MGFFSIPTPNRTKRAFAKNERLTHAQFAEKHVYFKGADVSPFTGKLKLARSAHLRYVFELMDNPKNRRFALKWGSQTAKTLAITIPASLKLIREPSWIHWIYPTKDKVADLIRVKLDKTLKSISVLWQKLEDFKDDEKIRDKRTIKEVEGGGIYITGTTPNDLKSISVPLTIGDEIAEMEKGVMAEAEERQKAYTKVFPRTIGASTIVDEDDEICSFYDSCECKLEYHIICPDCGDTYGDKIEEVVEYRGSENERIVPKTFYIPTIQDYQAQTGIENIDDSAYLRYIVKHSHFKCPHCERKVYEQEREKLLYDGVGAKWVVIQGDVNESRSFGFSMGSLMSWVVTIEATVEAWYKAGEDTERLDKVYRNWFNQFYSESSKNTTEAGALVNLTSGINGEFIPDDTVALYMGVDTQKDHFWAIVVAYRVGKNPHVVHFSKPETFGQVYELFTSEWQYSDGSAYHHGIRRMAIDMLGYIEVEDVFNDKKGKEERIITVNRPQEVREFVYEFGEIEGQLEERERIYATMGKERLGDDSVYSLADMKIEIGSRREKRKLKYAKTNTTALKLAVNGYMNKSVMLANGEEVRDDTKNILTFNDDLIDSFVEEDKKHLFHQLTSEKYGIFKGKKYKSFRRIKKDNHALDCFGMVEFLATMDRVEKMELEEKHDNIEISDLFI